MYSMYTRVAGRLEHIRQDPEIAASKSGLYERMKVRSDSLLHNDTLGKPAPSGQALLAEKQKAQAAQRQPEPEQTQHQQRSFTRK